MRGRREAALQEALVRSSVSQAAQPGGALETDRSTPAGVALPGRSRGLREGTVFLALPGCPPDRSPGRGCPRAVGTRDLRPTPTLSAAWPSAPGPWARSSSVSLSGVRCPGAGPSSRTPRGAGTALQLPSTFSWGFENVASGFRRCSGAFCDGSRGHSSGGRLSS